MASTARALYLLQAQNRPGKANANNAQDADPFRWQACAHSSGRERLEIKEAAIKVAIKQGSKIATQLRSLVTATKYAEDPTGDTTIDELEDWIKNYDKTCRTHRDSRVFVGVAGTTGAGKTSLLNALLDIKDLLPTSDEAASTAVVCLIAWNDDDDPNHRFKAQVVFKDRGALIDELDLFFREFQERKALESRNNGADLAIIRDMRQADANLGDSYDKIAAIWGLEEDELADESTESLLTRNPDVLKLLGTTKEISEADDETFALKVKPYMDSTETKHSAAGKQFAAWPLIDEVRVFVKADILRHGVVLVDLPGLADVVESRQAVAKRYFSKLTLTAIVAPITRAADDQTGVSLMSEHQELSMQMDGKFHKKAFCVVLSKMDEINVDSYLRQHMKEAKADEELQEKLRLLEQYGEDLLRLRDDIKTARKACRKLKKQTKKAKAQKKVVNVINADSETTAMLRREARNAKKDYDAQLIATARLEKDEKRYANLQRTQDGFKHFWCLRARNRLQQDRFTKDFARRQRSIALNGQEDLYDGRINVFPVSASVYWRFPDAERMEQTPLGFPDRTYTGVPVLKAWLCEATAEERERHLTTSLSTLLGLYNDARAWSGNEWSDVQLDLSPDFIKQKLIEEPLSKFQKAISSLWKYTMRTIRAIDPLYVKNMEFVLDNCEKVCIELVERWSLKDPDDMRCKEKIHYLTYGANIDRHGGPFISRGKAGITYCWNKNLASIFLKVIAHTWNEAFNNRLPDLERLVLEKIAEIWDEFLESLRITAKAVSPGVMLLLDEEREVLGAIGEEIKDKLRGVFKGVRDHAASVHPTLQNHMQRAFGGAYKKAQRVKRGRGHFYARQTIIQGHARSNSRRMYREAFKNTALDLGRYLRLLPSLFRGVTSFGKARIEKHIQLLLSNVVPVNEGSQSEDEDTKDFKEQSRVATRQLTAQWAVYWKIGGPEQDALDNTPTKIPDEYAEKDPDDEESDEESDEDMDEDGEDDDGDSESEEEDDDDEE